MLLRSKHLPCRYAQRGRCRMCGACPVSMRTGLAITPIGHSRTSWHILLLNQLSLVEEHLEGVTGDETAENREDNEGPHLCQRDGASIDSRRN